MAKDDVVLPLGLALEGVDDDDTREDAIALFAIDVGSGFALIDLDGDGGGGDEGVMATGTPVTSNISSPSIAGTSSVGKHKSVVWADFD